MRRGARWFSVSVGALILSAPLAFYAWKARPHRAHFKPGPAGDAEPLAPLTEITPPERPYSVVLIVVDTLRADHLSGWGYPRPTSPHLDALAARGIRFAQAHSQAPWTTASVGSLMTSRYPTTLGILGERAALPEEVTTLAESLRAAGLATGAFVSHSFCSDEYNFDQGFETFNDENVLGHLGVSSTGVTDAALAWLDQVGHRPFFLWAHYFDPHFAYILHPEYAFDTPYDGPVRSDMKFSALGALTLGPADKAELERLYDSEVAWTDAQIGRLLDHLDDRTLVVFTADHGEEFLDHGRLGHSKTVYEELVHVPLVVSCPHWMPGVVEVPVANLDVFPTVLACLGAAGPPDLAGRPLGPEPPTSKTVFTQTAKRNGIVAAIRGTEKVIRSKNGAERYDLATDPGERNNLGVSPDHPLLAELIRWEASLKAGRRDPIAVELVPAERAALEALGYVGE